MKRSVGTLLVFAMLSLLTQPYSLHAQTTPQELTRTILHKDSLFWTGYNRCDTALTGQFLADDLEFYHDKGGIINGRKDLNMALKKNLCSNPDWHLRREALPGTVKVFPLQNGDTIYGALISGEHYFYITEKGKPEFRNGHANFTHLWLKQNGVWKMTRILSFDHHAAAYNNTRKTMVVAPAVLKQYIGRYQGPQTDSLFIGAEKGTLVMVARNNKTTLYPETPNTFFVKERDLTFEFIRNNQQKVTGLRVRENGAIAEELALVE